MAKDMNETNGDPLDLLLRGWADRHAADSGSLDRVQCAIGQAMEQDAQSQVGESTVAAPGRWQSRALWPSIGVVAALLLAIVSIMLWPTSSPKQPEIARSYPPPGSGGVQAAITPDQVARDTKLFAELDRLFGRQLRWVAESDGKLDLGIEPDAAAAPPANSKPVTIHFTVVKRGRGDRDWSVVWRVNLVARNEQLVQLQPAQADSPSLMVWTYTLADGKIACDADLSLGGSQGWHMKASELQSAGDVRELASAAEGGVEYRVYQAVQLLDHEVI
jgi:hypothetical protein